MRASERAYVSVNVYASLSTYMFVFGFVQVIKHTKVETSNWIVVYVQSKQKKRVSQNQLIVYIHEVETNRYIRFWIRRHFSITIVSFSYVNIRDYLIWTFLFHCLLHHSTTNWSIASDEFGHPTVSSAKSQSTRARNRNETRTDHETKWHHNDWSRGT